MFGKKRARIEKKINDNSVYRKKQEKYLFFLNERDNFFPVLVELILTESLTERRLKLNIAMPVSSILFHPILNFNKLKCHLVQHNINQMY